MEEKSAILEGELPWAEGRFSAPDLRIHDIAPVGRKGRYTMTDLAADHTLFSAAVLAATGLAVAPVSIYWAESGLPEHEAPVMIEVPRTTFNGLLPPFDRIVYACPDEHAQQLLRFLDRFAVSRPDGIWESVHQRIPVVDWAAVNAKAVAPKVAPTKTVHLYGVESWHTLVHWVPPRNPWKEPVCLKSKDKRSQPEPKKRKRMPFT